MIAQGSIGAPRLHGDMQWTCTHCNLLAGYICRYANRIAVITAAGAVTKKVSGSRNLGIWVGFPADEDCLICNADHGYS